MHFERTCDVCEESFVFEDELTETVECPDCGKVSCLSCFLKADEGDGNFDCCEN